MIRKRGFICAGEDGEQRDGDAFKIAGFKRPIQFG